MEEEYTDSEYFKNLKGCLVSSIIAVSVIGLIVIALLVL